VGRHVQACNHCARKGLLRQDIGNPARNQAFRALSNRYVDDNENRQRDGKNRR
jgi:hypothetical protein